MLTSILNEYPFPKFIIIQDSLPNRGNNILFSILQTHLKQNRNYNIHFFVFENDPNEIKKLFPQFPNTRFFIHDCFTKSDFPEDIQSPETSGLIFIDSLAQVIIEHGLPNTYKLLNRLLNQQEKNIIQIATVLHEDTLECKVDTLRYFDQIATLVLRLELFQGNPRVHYKHRKLGGKIVKKMEEYYFQDGVFLTRPLPKMEVTKLLMNKTVGTLPENMSTFKISLEDNEKKSREMLSLPYLKKTNFDQGKSGSGSVIYNLDDFDDWDDEDPDDDLDI